MLKRLMVICLICSIATQVIAADILQDEILPYIQTDFDISALENGTKVKNVKIVSNTEINTVIIDKKPLQWVGLYVTYTVITFYDGWSVVESRGINVLCLLENNKMVTIKYSSPIILKQHREINV